MNVLLVVSSVPWRIISVIPSWQRSNDSTGKPLRTLRYDGVLTSHTDGVFPLLTDNQQDLADKFDAEAYVEKLIGQIYTEIVSDRGPGMRCCKDGRTREYDRRILYRPIGKGRVGLSRLSRVSHSTARSPITSVSGHEFEEFKNDVFLAPRGRSAGSSIWQVAEEVNAEHN